MYEFLFEACIVKCLNYVWIFIWSMYFKVLWIFIWSMNFFMYFKIPYDFTIYDPFLRFEFVLYFPCRVKIAILTTLFEVVR
jgi:hypothetical protein